jgi:hypothetical protein
MIRPSLDHFSDFQQRSLGVGFVRMEKNEDVDVGIPDEWMRLTCHIRQGDWLNEIPDLRVGKPKSRLGKEAAKGQQYEDLAKVKPSPICRTGCPRAIHYCGKLLSGLE